MSWLKSSFIHLPGICAVVVQSLEVFTGDEFATIHPGLNSPETAKYTDLFHGADDGTYIQALQLGVHGVQPSDQMFQEEVENLRQAY